MALVDVLIPTCDRKTALAIVLTSLFAQTFKDFNVVVSDQSRDADLLQCPEIQTLRRALEWHGHHVSIEQHLPRRGMAEQRHYLLSHSSAPYVHFLDDDLLLDPQVMSRMLNVLRNEGCGFVGCAATGLHLLDDERPQQQGIELWDGPVRPEPFAPDSIPWHRHLVNNAANPLHLERKLAHEREVIRYKVAWIGGANVLYDREKLLAVGGFSWWERLPANHAGEEVVAQFLLVRRFGGCGILPSGTYHLDVPTRVPDREINAVELFGELIRELERQSQHISDAPKDWARVPANSAFEGRADANRGLQPRVGAATRSVAVSSSDARERADREEGR